MGTKSIHEIVEAALVSHLTAQTELSGVHVLPGIAVATMTLPTVVVSCESANAPAEIPGGLGNYSCTVNVGVFSSADEATATTVHRARTAAVLGALQDVTAVKAVFASQGDATCYDVVYGDNIPGNGDRALGAMLSYTVHVVLPP